MKPIIIPAHPLKKPKGGARPGAGRKSRDGAKTERVELRLDTASKAMFKTLGGGDVSLGAREAASRLMGNPPRDWEK